MTLEISILKQCLYIMINDLIYFEQGHKTFSLYIGDLPKIIEKHCAISTNNKNIFKLQILNCVPYFALERIFKLKIS